MSAMWPVQVAIYTALTGDAALMARISGVYDGEAPQGAAFPYIVLDSATEVGANTLGRTGWSDTLMVHVWSSYAGDREIKEILSLLDVALADPLPIEGHQTVRAKRRTEIAEANTDPDGSRHLPVRYRVTTRETAA